VMSRSAEMLPKASRRAHLDEGAAGVCAAYARQNCRETCTRDLMRIDTVRTSLEGRGSWLQLNLRHLGGRCGRPGRHPFRTRLIPRQRSAAMPDPLAGGRRLS
jgi:hypothetical protein